jgi:hypothetical protein
LTQSPGPSAGPVKWRPICVWAEEAVTPVVVPCALALEAKTSEEQTAVRAKALTLLAKVLAIEPRMDTLLSSKRDLTIIAVYYPKANSYLSFKQF